MSAVAPQRPVRVVIADDNAAVSALIARSFAGVPEIDLLAAARGGRECVAAVDQHDPDVVVLDLVMPDMDGLGVLDRVRSRHPELPVIMFSNFTRIGSREAAEAFAHGATECLAKPSFVSATPDDAQSALKRLAERVVVLGRAERKRLKRDAVDAGGLPTSGANAVPTLPTSARRGKRAAAPGPIEALVIGSSTGGPEALVTMLGGLPADLPVPVLVAQHMPPGFTESLAARLDLQVPMKVAEAVGGERPRPGEVWLAPGGRHLEVRTGPDGGPQLLVHDGPRVQFCRPSVDVLVASAVAHYGGNLAVIILTGMGADGTEGCRLVKEAGGVVLVQDEASSVVWGMPGSVWQAGLADNIHALTTLPLAFLARLRDRSRGAEEARGSSPADDRSAR
jgi:two-component system chemotaxis response regulator CheB